MFASFTMFGSSSSGLGSHRLVGPPFVALALGAAVLSLLPSPAAAIQTPDHLRGRDALELATPRSLRSHREGSWDRPAPGLRARALARLEAEIGPTWARFDRHGGQLDTLIPHALHVPGSVASSERAREFVAGLLADHGDLLAPGIDARELVLLSDLHEANQRTLAFGQTRGGVPIVGGQLSVRFVDDRLVLVRSQLVPDAAALLVPTTTPLPSERALARARSWIADDFAGGRVAATRASNPTRMLLPLVHEGGFVELLDTLALEVELDQPIGRWVVYLDAQTGDPLARRSTLMWANLQIDAPLRTPLQERGHFVAKSANVVVGGTPTTTDAQGNFTVAQVNLQAQFALSGPLVNVSNAAGPSASLVQPVSPNTIVLWTGGDVDEQLDAQLASFVHARIVKDHVRSIAPDFAYLDQQLSVTTNIEDVCNAFSDGDAVNFFLSGGGCENSGRIADVVYHEFGHSVHTQALIPGVGLFEGALSEGISDYLAATIVDDASMGVGFFFDDTPIRELDPEGYEWHWPEDKGEVHDEGRIIGGALWDLRKAMRAQYGEAGIAETDRIWFESIRRAVDIPSMYLEALAANDDDGNLQNGTPDACLINDAFAAHGLFEPPSGATAIATNVQADGALVVELEVGETFPDCPSEVLPSLRWRVRANEGAPANATQTLAMQVDPQGRWRATIPPQQEFSVVQYQVELDWGNGTVSQRPDNFADPWYEHFFGEATEIWCSGFEGAPSSEWIMNGFDVGVPAGTSGDPDGAYAGTQVAGNVLDTPGTYPVGANASLRTLPIDVSGYEHVRLQYRRWLNVEDGFFDQAQILANGVPVWRNFVSPSEWATTHHRDREWRFHDVELTDEVGLGTLELAFTLTSDFGLEFGGWTIDEVCIVGHGAAQTAECGNGLVEFGEACDDANDIDGDGCSACVLDDEPSDETGDESGSESGDDPTQWVPDGRGCGCTSSDDPAHERLAGLALLGLLALVRRRR